MAEQSKVSLWRSIQDIRRDELPMALLMFFYFFLVITSFWILKPIKKGLFIEFYETSGFDLFAWHLEASQAELIAKVMNMVIAFIAVTVFTLLARKLRRHQLTYVFSGFFIAGYLAYSLILDKPGDWTVWSFYFFGDLFSTVMVATFFAFLNDSVSPGAAKRLYGLIGLGGTAGGAFGSMVVAGFVDTLSKPEWLWLCSLVAAVIIVLAMSAARKLPTRQEEQASAPEPETKKASEGNPALEGAKLALRSRYLLSVAAIVGLYEMVSTIMDFQFTSTIIYYLDGEAIGAQFARVFMITNFVAMGVQLFLTSLVMTRFGVGTALLVLPCAALLGSTGFMIAPILLIGSALNTCDNGFSYSVNQSAKEVLYVPTTRDEKYKAKAFIDMFVQRFAKALAVGLSLIITLAFTGFESLRWLSLVTIVILVLWILAVRYVGGQFRSVNEVAEEENEAGTEVEKVR